MVAAGFANFISTLSWTTNDVTFTLGQALDLLPPVLFLHVFLAFPSGRLHDPFERALVASAYLVAVALQVTRMTLGGFGPNNLFELTFNEDAGSAHAPRGALDDERFLPRGCGRPPASQAAAADSFVALVSSSWMRLRSGS